MELTELARQLLTALSPIIAQGALAKVGEETTDHVTALGRRAWAALEQRFQGNRQAESALTVYEEEPDDPKSQERVARHIVTHFRDDPQAIAELTDLVRELQALPGTQVQSSRSATVRDQARVGTLIQGDIGGNATFGNTSFGDQVNAQGSQGFVNRPSGPVRQNFGTPPPRKTEEDTEQGE